MAMGLAVLGLTQEAPGQDDLEHQLKAEQAALDSLKGRLEADRERLARTETEQRSTSAALEQLERDILRIRGELRSLERRERELAGRLGATREEIGEVDARLGAREEGIALRLRRMYKLGRRGWMQILFSADSFTDALKRVRYLSRVAEQDRSDFRAIRADRRKAGNVLALQRKQHDHQMTLVGAKAETERALERKMGERSDRLGRLRRDAAAMARAIREHQEAIARSDEVVRDLIQEIQNRQQLGQRLAELPPFDFEAHRGALRRPVSGTVAARFGRHQDPELKTWTVNRGVNVAAPEGTDVVAVAPGEAVLVDWYRGYGQFVLLRHPGGFYTLYGHLQTVLVNKGEILAEGAGIGTVGSTGRLDGEPQLHFEVMRGEEVLDPEVWLSPAGSR